MADTADKMDRRTFLKSTAALAGAGVLLAGAGGGLSSCVSHTALRPKDSAPLDLLLREKLRVMWVAAHPDDETMVGAILAYASLRCGCPLSMVVLTRGDGGECCLEEGCKPDLATIRAGEMKVAAELYKAELTQGSYFNAPLPVESFPKRHELAKIWKDKYDPTLFIGERIRYHKPDVVFIFEPTHGFTGHPEHQVCSRFTQAAIRLAADAGTTALKGTPHHVEHCYYVLNRYWPFALALQTDPLPVTETFDATQPCILGHSCREIQAHFTKAHRTQKRDMDDIRNFIALWEKIYLRHVDPFTQILDPFEPV